MTHPLPLDRAENPRLGWWDHLPEIFAGLAAGTIIAGLIAWRMGTLSYFLEDFEMGWIILIALDIPTVMLRGFVLSRLWAWFLVPLGLVHVGVWHAIGIAMLVGILTKNPFATETDDDEKGLAKSFGRLIALNVGSLLSWGMGAIVASFM